MSTTEGAGVEALYPFLYVRPTDPDALLEEVRRSCVAKAREIVSLREEVAARHGEDLSRCAARMAAAFASGGRLFAFGNGGSATDAQALAQLFAHPARGRAHPATCLSADMAVVTALSNDVGYDLALARQVAAFARPGDVVVGLSTSGGSANVLNALREARRRRALTVGVAGGDGGRMAADDAADHLFVVPSSSVHRIQEAQTTLCHVLWELVQEAPAGDG
ncbi:SIS domain-containing protein [Nonomuraea spiralis]|uniref:D-sedoheptulose-7-phosphate isomerase n=1 Tax=Nonomuraea TaxID=83681 RepID=UPI000F7BA67F|nr:SIS domain-containing protein [Nonomuraea sp. WAC 01424]RSN09321.1 phosphoheptose isomerase [Nonomuraea sp. WAC 01424]